MFDMNKNITLIRNLIAFILLITNVCLFSQTFKISKVEPPNWWSGMKTSEIQLMIYGENLSNVSVSSESDNLKVLNSVHTQNNNYLFVNIKILSGIDSTNSFSARLRFTDEIHDTVINFPVLARVHRTSHSGFSTDDVIYLIFTDRFVDGDSSNDKINNPYEKFPFGDLNGRHGGDLKGIIDYLDYLKYLGVTALWITPVLENNMWMSYHGYAATDLYKIDPRFGTKELYKNLVDLAHQKGLKIIMDQVTNHIGINHEWVHNPPTPTWFNGTQENHLPAHHDKLAFIDMHGDSVTYLKTERGWFTDYMPDLNQRDSLLAKYLIQNTLWWIEYLGIDGIREDTYSYVNQKFLGKWAKVILDEYPEFNIVGEIWKGEPAFLAKYQHNSIYSRDFDSNLPAVFDFALADAIRDFLSGKNGFRGIYETIAEDFVYSNPENLVTFIDNHDIDRALFVANGNTDKFKIALALILTTRGIPQILYGTEIGMNGGGHHGKIRASFPLELNGDTLSVVDNIPSEKGKEIFGFTKKLLKLRKNYRAFRKGKLIHYPPGENFYVYKRVLEDQKIIIMLNNSDSLKIKLTDFYSSENIPRGLRNLLSGEYVDTSSGEIEINNPVNIFLEN